MAKFGDKIDPKQMKVGKPPLLFQLQPDGYIEVTSNAAIKDWEEGLKKYYGLDAKAFGKIRRLMTCSNQEWDDCGGEL
jgi:hypothetical protein